MKCGGGEAFKGLCSIIIAMAPVSEQIQAQSALSPHVSIQ